MGLGRVNTNLKWPGHVIGLLKQKSSLFMNRSLENQFPSLVFHCYNQPLTKHVSIGWLESFRLAHRCIQVHCHHEFGNNEGAKAGGGGFGSRFMRGKTAISHFTGKKLVISRNLMNSFLTV